MPTADVVTLTLLQAWPAVAVAVAVTRHGLYSIDRLVNRTLVYAALTALLVAAYALVALLAGLVVGASALTASLATVAAALLFLPLRDRLQRAVDRRFARRRFEAVRLLRDFLDEVRDGHAEPEDVGASCGSRSATRTRRSSSSFRRPLPSPTATDARSTSPATGASAP